MAKIITIKGKYAINGNRIIGGKILTPDNVEFESLYLNADCIVYIERINMPLMTKEIYSKYLNQGSKCSLDESYKWIEESKKSMDYTKILLKGDYSPVYTKITIPALIKLINN